MKLLCKKRKKYPWGKNFNEEESEPSLGFMGQNKIYALDVTNDLLGHRLVKSNLSQNCSSYKRMEEGAFAAALLV